MAKPVVTVIDYGLGNLYSVSRALETVGAEALLTADPAIIAKAERVILPGVGAFEDGMKGLNELGLVDVIRSVIKAGTPFLGICLGMQMLFEECDEFGLHQGIGVIPGRVTSIPNVTASGQPHKIPHIGWNQLLMPPLIKSWEGTILAGLTPGQVSCYFVHSFTAWPADEADRLADCDYNGQRICATVRSGELGNVYGTQYHPEKSGLLGLQMLTNFLALKPAPALTH